MRWGREAPTEAGRYCYRTRKGSERREAMVWVEADGAILGGCTWMPTRVTLGGAAHTTTGWWAGPLPEPEEPK